MAKKAKASGSGKATGQKITFGKKTKKGKAKKKIGPKDSKPKKYSGQGR